MTSNPLVHCAAIILIIAGLVTSYWCSTTLLDVQHRTEVASALLTTEDEVSNLLLNAETGQRGYILTGMEEYLESYHNARGALPHVIAALDKLALDPDQDAFRRTVEPVIAAKLNELANTVTLRRENGFEPALAVVKSDEGRSLMDRLRILFRDQRAKTVATLTDLRKTTGAMVRGILTGIVMMVLGSLAFYLRAKPRSRPAIPLPTLLF